MTSIIRVSTFTTTIRTSTSTSIVPPPSERVLQPFEQPTAQRKPSLPHKLKGFVGIPPVPSTPPLSPCDYFLLAQSARSVSPAPRPLTPTVPPLSSLAFTPSNNLYGSKTREKEEKCSTKRT